MKCELLKNNETIKLQNIISAIYNFGKCSLEYKGKIQIP